MKDKKQFTIMTKSNNIPCYHKGLWVHFQRSFRWILSNHGRPRTNSHKWRHTTRWHHPLFGNSSWLYF